MLDAVLWFAIVNEEFSLSLRSIMEAMNIDLEFGLKQLSGNKALLFKMFGKFRDEYQDVTQKIQAHLDDGEYTDACRVVHTIKGVSGNLGLTTLHNASREFEAFLKSLQPDMDVAKKAFNDVLLSTLTEIDTLINEDSEEAEATGTDSQNTSNSDSKEALLGALERNEFIAPDRLEEMVATLALSASEQAQLIEHIGDLDYSEAIELINDRG